MTSPRFSVVIPTREGASTLKYTLQTCLMQDFDDYEIVVCDNFSSPATRQVVEEANSPRVKYVRSDKPLAMSSNWELAVSQATGQYITVLGDDDALLPHAFRVLDHLLERSGTRAIRWDAAFYLWPTIALPEEANYLRLPVCNSVETLDGRLAIASVIRFARCYSTLPMLYNSVVERALLDDLRRRAGRLFLTRYPDVCSGFMVASSVGQYLSTDVPMTIAGLSHKSVGVGHHMIPKQNEIGKEFLRLNDGEGVKMRRLVPDLHVFPVVPVADCFQAVKEALFSKDDTLELDRKTIASNCVGCLRADSADNWNRCMATIRDTLSDDPELIKWFDEMFGNYPPNLSGHLPLRHAHLGFTGEYLHLETTPFGVRDVVGAAKLCDQLLAYRGSDLGARLHINTVQSEEDMLETQSQEKLKMHRQLVEKEAEIQRLVAESDERLRIIRVLERQLQAPPPPPPPSLPRRAVGKLLRVLGLRKSA